MNKKLLQKLVKPGTWVTIGWLDAPNETALVLSADKEFGIDVFHRGSKRWEETNVDWKQIVAVNGALDMPKG